MKNIVLVPCGGLANRLRAIASIVDIGKKFNCIPTVVWICNNDINCRFSTLFNLPSSEDCIITEPSAFEVFTKYQIPRKRNLYVSYIYLHLAFDLRIYEGKNLPDFFDTNNRLDLEKIRPYQRIYIFSGENLSNFSPQLYRSLFQFTPQVIDRALSILGGNSLIDAAIHIRRTDNSMSIEHSPVSLFQQQVESIIADNRNSKIFLATDDQQVKKHFSTLFPNNIIINPVQASRTTKAGMVDAAAELYILSKSNRLYGSYWSSFTEAAAMHGNIPLTIIKK